MKDNGIFIAAALLALPALAQEPVRYTLSFPAPHTHYLEVSATVPVAKTPVDLFMAVWTPGSYMVREYAKDVESFEARTPDGGVLAWEKTRKNRWRVQSAGAKTIEVRYKVYAHNSSVQGNWVDAGFAMLNGAPNFMTLVGGEKRPYEVKLNLPPAWRESISGMGRKNGDPNTYAAADFDELLDCPIYAGSAPIHEFEVLGRKHYLVNEGEGPMWDGPASARDVKKIVEEFARMWGGLPYQHYVFFNMIVEAGGGLEHRNSTWMNTSRWAYGNDAEPAAPGAVPAGGRRVPTRGSWLGLVSHEYFHAWNVKRLRPEALGPFDYENENYTSSLWISEGFTSYYGPLALKRAGLSTQGRLLNAMSGAIRSLQTTPGRLVQPVELSSFDTWIKLYRPDENSANTAISYYTKGNVIAFLLDVKVRLLTEGRKSLDDVMRLVYSRFSGERGFTPQQFRAAAGEVAGADLGAWFKKVLETTEELDYSEALQWYGLRFRAPQERPRREIQTGLTVRTEEGRLLVTAVRRDTPGWTAGVNVSDEIIAVNEIRVAGAEWPSRLERYRDGETVKLLVARRGRLMTIEMQVEDEAPASWALEVNPQATEQQKANLAAWLR